MNVIADVISAESASIMAVLVFSTTHNVCSAISAALCSSPIASGSAATNADIWHAVSSPSAT